MLKNRPCLFSMVIFLISILTVLTSCSVQRSSSVRKEGFSQITPEFLKKNIDYLASDSMKGRNTPSPELDSAAHYIAGFFKAIGLAPVNGSYFQEFSICSKNLGDENHLNIVNKGIKKEFQIKSEYMPYDVTGANKVSTGLVFAGYGITAPEYQWDDYGQVDAKGKTVVVFRHEPRENDSAATIFDGIESTRHSDLKVKLKNAKAHGAVAMLVVTEPLNYRSIRPRGFPWPSLSKNLPKDALPTGFCIDNTDSIPVVQIGEEVISSLFGGIDSLKHLQMLIDSTLAPCSFGLPGVTVDMRISVRNEVKYTTRNVAGFLQGSDTLPGKEVIVIGAHYDHVGFLKEHKADTDYIFNGADDNASGTSGVLAVAHAMTSLKSRPGRSILFMLFAGEEKGLYGSGYYVKRPLFPLGSTVAMLNMDMISRNSRDSLEIIGAQQCPALFSIVRSENKTTGFVLKPENMEGGSDHWNFYKHDVPSIFFFSGFHPDYHKVTDNPDRSDPVKAAEVARLVFLTAWHIARDKEHYTIIHGSEREY